MIGSALVVLALLLGGALPVAALVVAIVALNRARGRGARSNEERIADLEAAVVRLKRGLAEREPPAPEAPAAEVAPVPVPPPAPVPSPFPSPAPPPPPSPPAARRPAIDLEQRIGARWTTWVGVIAILFAVAFLLRWTFENNVIGPKGRVVLGLAAGAVMLGSGLVLEWVRRYAISAVGLAGGGLGILYLSLYAAYGFYHFLAAGTAFGLMFAVTVAGSAVSVATRQPATAVLAILGGLITPILVSTRTPNEAILLGYLLVLDLMVLGVAAYRSWPGLNRFAWVGTFVLYMPVLLKHPDPASPWVRMSLLTSLFAVFLAVPIARAWRERKGVGEPDLILTLGNAAAYFGAVYVTLDVVRPPLEGPWAFVLASLYLALALVHRARVPGDEAGSSLLEAIGWIFFVIAFPLLADGPWVTLGWAATGVALIRLAPRVRSPVAMWGGLVTLLLAVMRAAVFDPRWYPASRPVWNFPFAVQLLVVVALAVAGWLAVGIPVEMRFGNRGRDLRSLLWFVAGALLALLFWREPRGLTPSLLLGAELVGCAWLARRKPDVVFAPLALMLTGIILVRVVGLDIDRSRSAAVSLLNAPLGARVLVCAAIALAGVLLKTEGLGRLERTTGQVLQATAGVMLLVVLSTGWVMHQDVRVDAARSGRDPGDPRRIRWLMMVGLSILWTAYAAVALAWGFLRGSRPIRYAALALLGITIAKVFLADLAELQAIYRILSFLVLGLVLLGVSFAYQRLKGSSPSPPGS